MNAPIEISEPAQKEKFSIFSYGFRPFFLAAGIYAILPLIPWALFLSGNFDPEIPLQSWHAHEMLFGFVAAAISGFLLTAIPNWTNTSPLTGSGLKKLFLFWLSGRIAFWLFLIFPHPIFGYLLFLDLLLPIAQGIRITRIITSTGNKRNLIFIGIMSVLAMANLLVILDLNNITNNTAQIGAILAPNIIMIMIAVVGGRVTPNFTRSYLQQQNIKANIRTFPIIEKLAIGLLALNAVIDIIIPHSTTSYTIALIACAIHTIRFSQWESLKTLNDPIVWILHLGYAWLVVTLFLKGAEGFMDIPYNLYLHAFTVGAVGTYILGIMTRATLGHTGRPLQVSTTIRVAYLFILTAATIRIMTPFYTEFYTSGMMLTTALWVGAFALYLWVYVPILTSPRIDGKEG